MRLFELVCLFEGRMENIINSRGQRIVAQVKTREGKTMSAEAILAQLATGDPTSQAKNIQWIVNQYMQNQFRLEDMPRLKTELTQFATIRNKLPKKDLNQYTYHDLQDTVDEAFNKVDLKTPEAKTKQDYGKDVKVLYDGPLGTLMIPQTMEAAQRVGSGTKWCTSAADEEHNLFDHYHPEGDLNIWRDKSGKKFQFWFAERADSQLPQFMDSSDRELTPEQLKYWRNHPVIGKLFKQQLTKMVEGPLDTALDRIIEFVRLTDEAWPEGEPFILKDLHCAFDYYLTGYRKGRWPELEEAIFDHGTVDDVSAYAINVIDGRWYEGEEWLYDHVPDEMWVYANKVIKGRWDDAEDHLLALEDPKMLWDWCEHVIKGPWPEAEEFIKKSNRLWNDYEDIFLS